VCLANGLRPYHEHCGGLRIGWPGDLFRFSHEQLLLEFLKTYRHDLRQVTGVRYHGKLSQPFHVVDNDSEFHGDRIPLYVRR
jgi:hypothetical protein